MARFAQRKFAQLRFAQLPVATQKLVLAAGLVVAVLAGGSLSWHLHQQVTAAQLRRDAAVANLQGMSELVQRYRELQAAGAGGTGAAGDLSAVVTRSLQGKTFQPNRIQQQNGELALRLDNAPFNEVLAWLLELEESGAVVLGNVSITQAQPAGVTLTVALRGG